MSVGIYKTMHTNTSFLSRAKAYQVIKKVPSVNRVQLPITYHLVPTSQNTRELLIDVLARASLIIKALFKKTHSSWFHFTQRAKMVQNINVLGLETIVA